jgi:hypothetical protein
MSATRFGKDNGLFDKDDVYLRGQLRWEPTPELDMTLRGSLWRQGGNGGSDFGYFVAGVPIDPNGGTFTFSDVINAKLNPINPRVGAGINTPSDAGPYSIARDALVRSRHGAAHARLRSQLRLRTGAAKLLVGYADFETYRTADADLSIQPSGFEYQLDTAKTFTQELQLSSTGDGPFQYTSAPSTSPTRRWDLRLRPHLQHQCRQPADPDVTGAHRRLQLPRRRRYGIAGVLRPGHLQPYRRSSRHRRHPVDARQEGFQPPHQRHLHAAAGLHQARRSRTAPPSRRLPIGLRPSSTSRRTTCFTQASPPASRRAASTAAPTR